jgi:hydrogenase nickel incorporation protein HypB
MCDTCGCNVTPTNRLSATVSSTDGETVDVLHSLLHANNEQAQHNRQHFQQHSVLAINLMSSPGAGKTLLLEATIEALGNEFRIAVIEGDLETENDAARIRAKGVPAIQINTGTACHLDAEMVHSALHETELDNIDILFIENVGNLVCPASFDLGQHLNVALLSTPEGHDKPAKYPVMFRAADSIVINKCDLLAVLDDFDPAVARNYIRQLATDAPVLEVSAKTGAGVQGWTDWIRSEFGKRATGTDQLRVAGS